MREIGISTTLVRIRQARMWTQGRLAEEARVSPTTISGIESGRIPRPHFGTVRKLREALGVSPEQLLYPVEVLVVEKQREASPPLSLGWAKTAREEEFEREIENAPLEDLDTLRRELEEEQVRLQKLYGESQGLQQQRDIKRHIRNVAAQRGPVSTSIMFHREQQRRPQS
jgi:transcriptional regulator with XRE-family HTH domain